MRLTPGTALRILALALGLTGCHSDIEGEDIIKESVRSTWDDPKTAKQRPVRRLEDKTGPQLPPDGNLELVRPTRHAADGQVESR